MRPEIEYDETPSLMGARAVGPRDIPGSESIGNGYNVLDGDYATPLSTTFPLFDLGEKTELQIDESHTYNVPANVRWIPYRQGEFRIVTGKTINEHQTSLLQETGISGEYGAFKGSLDVSFDRSTFRRSCFEYVTCMDVIARWVLRLPHPTELASFLRPQVKDEINSLPPRELFEKYGTHYLSEIIVGGRATYSSVVNTLQYRSEYTLEVVARMSYQFGVGKVSAENKTRYTDSVSNFESNSSSKVRVIGGDPGYAKRIFDGEYDHWIESTDERPVFVGFGPKGLRPIWALCGDGARKKKLQRSYEKYRPEKAAIPTTFPLRTGDVIALQADNGLYLGRVQHRIEDHDRQLVTAEKGEPDEFSRFTVALRDDDTITLLADNHHYLGWINFHGWRIEASKTEPDEFSRFRATYFEGEGRMSLGTPYGYWRRAGIHTVPSEAIDDLCKFRVHIL